MPIVDSTDAAQTEDDGSDKPPHDSNANLHHPPLPTSSLTLVNGATTHHPSSNNPNQADKRIARGRMMTNTSSVPGSETPSATDSPSDSESWSIPSTRPPSQAPSRAPSMSAGVSGGKVTVPQPKPTSQKAKPPPSPQVPTTRSRAPSNAHSDGGHKFTLKDLISSAPKLSRKSSARSTGSSKKSDSDGDRKSVAGDSAVSLTQKYGVCQKVAIGKGATSIVRLAHKWDRSEEKLYAVKVGKQITSCASSIRCPVLITSLFLGVP
jgi:protein-serine/threonine kinase